MGFHDIEGTHHEVWSVAARSSPRSRPKNQTGKIYISGSSLAETRITSTEEE